MTNTPKQRLGFSQKVIAVALLAAFGPAHAEDEAPIGSPESSISAGLGITSGSNKDKSLFGQYNGMRKSDGFLLLDVDIRKRDDETGTWMTLQGANLGLDNRELGATYQKQGDWKVSADYSELVRRDPRTINTNLQGAGSSTPTVTPLLTPGTGGDLNLDLKRKGITLGAEKWITPNLLFEASFKNEDKDGARLSGRGIACGVYSPSNNVCGTNTTLAATLAATAGAILMLPEPVNTTTKQFEAKLNYSGEHLKLSGGYYGSFFSNANSALVPTVSPNSLWNPNGTALNTGTSANAALLGLLQLPVALAPDNQAHQLYLSGFYAFTPSTRANFKLAYTHATQNDGFGAGMTAPTGAGNLGGVANSTLAQFGLTARPLAKLSLVANLRYEDREDKTPYAQLYTSPTLNYVNSQNSAKKLTGKLEANYQLPDNYRAVLGVDYQSVDRDRPVGTNAYADAGFTALREQTKEVGYRAELRRSMSETLNATISYGQSQRDGGTWLNASAAGFPAAADATLSSRNTSYPMTKEDRRRDKAKVMADWTPFKELSLQFMLEDGKDRYTAPADTGLRDTGMQSYGVDAVWTISDNLKLNGYANQGYQTLHVNQTVGYMAALKDVSTSVGFGVTGKASAKLDIGGNLTFMNDSNRYQENMYSGAAVVGGGLPDVTYRLTRLKLFGKYALEKDADIRVDFVRQRAKLDDWAWGTNVASFVYSDNSTVSLQQNQNLTFLGVTYIYKMK